jgi:hypothetical protein
LEDGSTLIALLLGKYNWGNSLAVVLIECLLVFEELLIILRSCCGEAGLFRSVVCDKDI